MRRRRKLGAVMGCCLGCLMCLLSACNKADNTFSRLPAHFTMDNIYQSPVLYTACNSMGEFCTITGNTSDSLVNGGLYLNGANAVFRYNILHGNGAGTATEGVLHKHQGRAGGGRFHRTQGCGQQGF